MRLSTLLATALFLAAACLGGVACGAEPEGLPAVRIGIGLAKPPYIMESGDAGLEVDVAREALQAGGYRMVPVQLPPARGLAMFTAGQLDGLLTVDKGIGDVGHFSEPYLTYQNVAVTLAKRGIVLAKIDDLLPYSVAGFQNASVILGPQFKALTERHRRYKEHPQQITQDRLLYSGRVDVVVGDRLIFRYFSKHLDDALDATQPVTFHPIFPPNPRLAVFRDAAVRDAFDRGLKKLRADGRYAAIQKRYQEYTQP